MAGIFYFVLMVLTAAVYIGLLVIPIYLVVAFCRAMWREFHSGSLPNSRDSISA